MFDNQVAPVYDLLRSWAMSQRNTTEFAVPGDINELRERVSEMTAATAAIAEWISKNGSAPDPKGELKSMQPAE